MVDHNKCIGCRSCVAVCPFGAMGFNVIDRKNFKCDLCDGDPQCVRFCDMKAVDYIDADRVSIFKKKAAAEKNHCRPKRGRSPGGRTALIGLFQGFAD